MHHRPMCMMSTHPRSKKSAWHSAQHHRAPFRLTSAGRDGRCVPLPLFHFCHRILLTSQAVVQKIQINSKSNQHFDSQISCSLHLLTVKLLVLAHLALRTSLYNSYTFASVRAQPYCAPYTLNRDNATSMVSAVGVVGKVVV